MDQIVCSLCLGTGKVFVQNPPQNDTPRLPCICSIGQMHDYRCDDCRHMPPSTLQYLTWHCPKCGEPRPKVDR